MAFSQAWTGVQLNASFGAVTTGNLTTTTGNTVVVGVTSNSGAPASGDVTDSKGNSYGAPLATVQASGGDWIGIYACRNVTGGTTHNITFTHAAADYKCICAVELSGINGTVDVTGTGTGTGTALDSGSQTTTAADDIVGYFTLTTGTAVTWSGGNGTVRSQVTAADLGTIGALTTRDNVSAGATDVTLTCSNSGAWAAAFTSFKVSAGGTPIALRGAASVPSLTNTTTTCSLTVDAAVVANDLLFIVVASRDSTGAGTLSVTDNDTGGNAWTKFINSTDHKLTVWWKRATSATASKTVTVSNAVGSCTAVMKAFSGADTSATPYTNAGTETNAAGDETHAGITPTNADSMLCFAVVNYANDNAVTSMASANFGAFTMTERLSTGGSDCAAAFGHDLITSGATGNITWAQTDGTTYSAVWCIKQAAAGYTLTASPGSVGLTGTSATLKYNRLLTSSAGAVAIAGTAASLEYGREVSADPGAVAITGTDASLEYGRRLDAAAGTVVITGTDADLIYTAPQDYTLDAQPGAVTVTGTAAGLLYGRELQADAGAVDIAGTDAGLYFGREVAADPGAVTITGTAAGLLADRILVAESGSVAVAGTAAGLEYGRGLVADSGTVAVAGTAAGLLYGRRLDASAGAVVITGTAADLEYTQPGVYRLTADPGAVAITGQDAALTYTPLEPEPPPSPGAGGLGFNILTRPMRRPRPPLAAGMTPAVAVAAAVRRPAVLAASARGGMSARADAAESTRPGALTGMAGGGTVAQGATVTRAQVLPAGAVGAVYGSGRTAYELLEAF